jgi:hypothetical protein
MIDPAQWCPACGAEHDDPGLVGFATVAGPLLCDSCLAMEVKTDSELAYALASEWEPDPGDAWSGSELPHG